MGIIDRLKGKHDAAEPTEPTTEAREAALRARLEADPNDRDALLGLAEILAAPEEEELAAPLTAAKVESLASAAPPSVLFPVSVTSGPMREALGMSERNW